MKLNLIPMPKSVKCCRSIVKSAAKICSEDFPSQVAAFTELASRLHGVSFEIVHGGVTITKNDLLGCGCYTLSISDESISICAGDSDGAAYGLSTLLQLMEPCDEGFFSPALLIKDSPDCDFRTLMVDLARKWHPFCTLLEYVDLCYLYKIKFLHLHFIDSNLYTLPSDRFPKLNVEGSFYSKDEIRTLNEYAASRNVEIIPEIEAPGHCALLNQTYPELFDHVGDELSPIHIHVMCPGKKDIIDTLSHMADEVITLFPNSRYFHIGGDEACISVWDTCDDCKKYMTDNGINGIYPLYTEFIKRMTDMVIEKGKTPIVWEGFPRDGSETISRDTIVSVFESSYHIAPELLEEGFTMINATWQPLYIVPNRHWSAEEIMDWNIFRWQNWVPSSRAFETPIDIAPTDSVIGAQLCAWECTYEEEIDIIRENLAALSERTWSIRHRKEDSSFRERLSGILPLAQKLKNK